MATVQSPEEQRVVLRHASWETYERLLEERGEDRVPRYAYDKGRLEIVSPLTPEHEESSRDIEFVVRLAAQGLGLAIRSFGSMTLKREDLEGGAEPDGCYYYIQREGDIRGKRRPDLAVDPPPDLVIEVDVTHPTLDKLPIYARFGVPQVWRYDGHRLEICVLEGDRYRESPQSVALPGVAAEALERLLAESREMDSVAWQGRVMEWTRGLGGS